MARYRKIDIRVWNDENFLEMDPLQRLLWFALLTHPHMTPMGAGVLSVGLLDNIIGNAGGFCWRCNDTCSDHSGETILRTFAERSMILSQNVGENVLVIVKNFLFYNQPDNPNQLAGWIECVEELPRSPLWNDLYEHLLSVLSGEPEWLFSGLLKPLALNDIKGLKRKYWGRIKTSKPEPPAKGLPKRSGKRSAKGLPKRSGIPMAKQEQEQEQEQDIYKTSLSEVSDHDFRLAKLLYELIEINDPKFKPPNLKNWSQEIEKLIRIDHRSPDEIEAVIRWSQKDEFWKSNILSPSKLRKKFSQLLIKMGTKTISIKDVHQQNLDAFESARQDLFPDDIPEGDDDIEEGRYEEV